MSLALIDTMVRWLRSGAESPEPYVTTKPPTAMDQAAATTLAGTLTTSTARTQIIITDHATYPGAVFEWDYETQAFVLSQRTTEGAAHVADQTLHAGEYVAFDVQMTLGNFAPFAEISTATDTVVKSSKGYLHGIMINGGTLGAITIYDHATAATGTPKFTISTPTAALPLFLPIDCWFTAGIVIKTGGATVITPIGA